MRIREEFRAGRSGLFNAEAFGDWKEAIDNALEAVRILDPTAIVAGGACRDAILGNEIADIDIYMYQPIGVSLATMFERLSAIGFSNVERVGNRDDNANGAYAGMEHLSAVFNCTMLGKPVQVIVMDCPTFDNTVSSFGLNVSKCFYTGGDIVALTPAIRDMEGDTVTVPTGITVSARYVQKILDKLQPTFFCNEGFVAIDRGGVNIPVGTTLTGLGIFSYLNQPVQTIWTSDFNSPFYVPEPEPYVARDVRFTIPDAASGWATLNFGATRQRTTRVTEDSTDLDIDRLLPTGS